MDRKLVDKLEKEVEDAIIDIVARLGLRHLPLLPSQQTMRRMAKAAVAVYETEVEGEQ